jgi:hypothetical protein
LGGLDGVGGHYSTVYKATIDGNGDIGAFDTTNQAQLSQALYAHTTVTAAIGGTTFIYVLGGRNSGSGSVSTVYKATIDGNGDIGAFDTTNQGQLPQRLASPATISSEIGGTNYIYVLGGDRGPIQSTVYKATIDGNGDIGAFDTTDQGQLPHELAQHTAVSAAIGGTNYFYVLGGQDNGEQPQSTVYKAGLIALAPTDTPTPVPTDTPTPTDIPGSTSTPTPGPGTPPVCTDSKPGNPSNLTVTAGPSAGQITLNWTQAPSPVTDYSITYSDDPTTQKFGVVSTGNVTTYVISNLTPGVKYYFWVNAVNGCKPGDQIGPATLGGGSISNISTPSGTLLNTPVSPLPVTGPNGIVVIGVSGIAITILGAFLMLLL